MTKRGRIHGVGILIVLLLGAVALSRPAAALQFDVRTWVVPPVGSKCTERPGYGVVCLFPDGSWWQCTKTLTYCKRIGRSVTGGNAVVAPPAQTAVPTRPVRPFWRQQLPTWNGGARLR